MRLSANPIWSESKCNKLYTRVSTLSYRPRSSDRAIRGFAVKFRYPLLSMCGEQLFISRQNVKSGAIFFTKYRFSSHLTPFCRSEHIHCYYNNIKRIQRRTHKRHRRHWRRRRHGGALQSDTPRP